MSHAKETAEKKKRSSVTISSDSSPPSPRSKEKSKSSQSLRSHDVSPPAPVSSLIESKASLQTSDTSGPAPKAEAPKTSSPPPPEEKKSPSPPPAPNPPPKQTPKSSPPPSPPSPSRSPRSPTKRQSPPQQTPTTPTKQSPPQQEQPTTTTPTQQSPEQQSTDTPTQQSPPSSNAPDQKSTPSSTHTKKQSPSSPSNRIKKPSQSSQQNSPSDSKPAESTSDNNLSPPTPSTDTSQSPPPTYSTSAPTSTPTSVTGSIVTTTPGLPPQTSGVMPQPSAPISPSNSVRARGLSKNDNSGSSNNALSITDSKHPSSGFVVGATVVAVLIIAFVLFLFFRDRKEKRQQNSIAKFMATPANISVTSDGIKGLPPQNGQQSDMENGSDNQKGNNNGSDSGDIYVSKTSFTYEEMMEMTDGFARENMIGEGGFGCVYKGRLSDGKFVAVKQLKIGSGQGEREFRAEVEIITRVHHRHLVSLVGYCVANNQRLLVYEFVPNSTLERHLHGKDLPVLEWTKRVKIAEGAAKGLAYLHEDCHPKIIHRDIKSANILLDEDFEAQVADFGLARLNDTNHSHVSTRVMGTFGYLAPEYASSGKLSDRSDVYSFGVVILELITGRKPVDPTRPLGDESLVEWARPLLIEALRTGDFGGLIDPRLEKRYVESEMFRMMEAAAACVRHSVARRPRMALVARALDFEGDPDLSNGVKVGQSTAYDSAQYSEEISRFRRMEFGRDNSSESDIYSDDSISREFSGGLPNSGMSGYSSGESPIEQSGTQCSKPSPSGRYSGGSRNYGGGRFR